MTKDAFLKWLSIVVPVLGAAAVLSYQMGTVAQRVTNLEVHQTATDARMERSTATDERLSTSIGELSTSVKLLACREDRRRCDN